MRNQDDATKAGGGNLHRGRGATAWGREDGGDATKAGGGNLGEPLPGERRLRIRYVTVESSECQTFDDSILEVGGGSRVKTFKAKR